MMVGDTARQLPRRTEPTSPATSAGEHPPTLPPELYSRKFNMRRLLFACAFACVVATSNIAAGSIIHFDDLAGDTTFANSNYAGFDWGDNWETVDEDTYQTNFSNSYGAVSSANMASNTNGFREITTMNGGDFDFIGVYATGWAEFDSTAPFTSSTLTVEGWDDGVLVGSVTVGLSTDQFDWVAAGFNSIDTLVFLNDGQNEHYWLIDDFTYNMETFAVPEPASAMVWVAGFGLLCIRRRR